MVSHDSEKMGELHRKLHSRLPSEPALRAKALESALVAKGLLAPDTIDKWLETYSEKIGPKNGAVVIAKSWLEPDFQKLLEQDANKAFEQMGLADGSGHELKALFNSASIHNLVVCTLCSCYPLRQIGMSPLWYKSSEYRARAVREPRAVLREFGVKIGDDVEVRVWDSTSERRYLVVPVRPAGTEGWSQDDLARLVTRNSMIGTHRDLSPTVETA
jgi:nitrile hydratase subunit alpha